MPKERNTKGQFVKEPTPDADKEAAHYAQIEAEQDADAQEVEQAVDSGTPPIRTLGRGDLSRKMHGSNLPNPVDYSSPLIGPTAFGAVVVKHRRDDNPKKGLPQGEIEFYLEPTQVDNLKFQSPGLPLPKKKLYTVKAFKPNGTLTQLPFERQHNNQAAGDIQDAIGLRRYERKGFIILIDWKTMIPIYCGAAECYARAHVISMNEEYPEHAVMANTGFCSALHANHTSANRFNRDGSLRNSGFGEGATTTRNVYSL